MPSYLIVSKETLQNNISTIQYCFLHEAIFVEGGNTKKPIILTSNISTSTVCILFDPLSRLTVFAYLDEKVDIIHSQTKLLTYLYEKDIPLANLQVFIAGGWRSYPSSALHAKMLREFWSPLAKNTMNAELLFSRDGLSLDANEVMNYIRTKTIHQFIEHLGITQFNIIESYLLEMTEQNETFIYSQNESDTLPAKLFAKWVIEYCEQMIPHFDKYGDLTSIQIILDTDRMPKFLLVMQNPTKTFFPVVGFDAYTGRLFISHEDCSEVINQVIHSLELQTRASIAIEKNHDNEEYKYLKEVQDSYKLSRNSKHTHSLIQPIETLEQKLQTCTARFFNKPTQTQWKEYPKEYLSGKRAGHHVRFFTISATDSRYTKNFLNHLKKSGFDTEIAVVKGQPFLIADLTTSTFTF